MEKVYFFPNDVFSKKAEEAFIIHKKSINNILPKADIQHVGSTAIPNSLTKGDLDIQVRVTKEQFERAVEVLSKMYDTNEGSVKTSFFRAFKDDEAKPPLGVQLSVIGSEYDIFWKFREVLLKNDQFRIEYDEIKKKYEGKDMEEYRNEKNEFFQRLTKTSEFKEL